ncbi:hypothetical protein GJAV_G00134290 [Gymnothorax javanicus]|nr:hypothetical protein GJAV_G00134290 [Gymnothorax javanicus]
MAPTSSEVVPRLSGQFPSNQRVLLCRNMASWLQVVSLLVMLVLSSPRVDAGSTQHLCGSRLVDALYLVCGEKGFLFNPKGKQDLEPPQGQEEESRDVPTKDHKELRVLRNVVEQCCHKPCNIFDLQNYCN